MGARELACLATWLILTALTPTAAEKSKFCQYKHSCSECKYLYDNLRSLLSTLTKLQENEFRGVCEKCTMTYIKTQCGKCTKLINIFLNKKANDYEHSQINVKKWLENVKNLLGNVIDKDNAMLRELLSKSSLLINPRGTITEHLFRRSHVLRDLGPDAIPEKPVPSISLQKMQRDVTGEFQKLLYVLKEPVAMRQLEVYDFPQSVFDPRNSTEILNEVRAKLTEAKTSPPGHNVLAIFEEAKNLIPGYSALTKLEELGKVLLSLPLHDCLAKINEVKELLPEPNHEILTKLNVIRSLLLNGAALGALDQLEEGKKILRKLTGQRAITAIDIFKKELPLHEAVSKLTEFKKYFPAGHIASSKLEKALKSPLGPELLYRLEELKKVLPFGHVGVRRLEKIIRALTGHDKQSKLLEVKMSAPIYHELRRLEDVMKGLADHAASAILEEALALSPGSDLLVKLEELKKNLPAGHPAVALVNQTMRHIPGYKDFIKDVEKMENIKKNLVNLEECIKSLPDDHQAKILLEQAMKSFPLAKSDLLVKLEELKKNLPAGDPAVSRVDQTMRHIPGYEDFIKDVQKMENFNKNFENLKECIKLLPSDNQAKILFEQAMKSFPAAKSLKYLDEIQKILPPDHPFSVKAMQIGKQFNNLEKSPALQRAQKVALVNNDIKNLITIVKDLPGGSKIRKLLMHLNTDTPESELLAILKNVENTIPEGHPAKAQLIPLKETLEKMEKSAGASVTFDKPCHESPESLTTLPLKSIIKTKKKKPIEHRLSDSVNDFQILFPKLHDTIKSGIGKSFEPSSIVEKTRTPEKTKEIDLGGKIYKVKRQNEAEDENELQDITKDKLKSSSSLTLQLDTKIYEKFKEIEKNRKLRNVTSKKPPQKSIDKRETTSQGAFGGEINKTMSKPILTKEDSQNIYDKLHLKEKLKKETIAGRQKSLQDTKITSGEKLMQLKPKVNSEVTLAKLKPNEATLTEIVPSSIKDETKVTAEHSKDEAEEADGKTASVMGKKSKGKKKIEEKEEIHISASEKRLMKVKETTERTLTNLKPKEGTPAKLLGESMQDEKKGLGELKGTSRVILAEADEGKKKNKDIDAKSKKSKQKPNKKGKDVNSIDQQIDSDSAKENYKSNDKKKEKKERKKPLKPTKSEKMLMQADKMLVKLLKQREKEKRERRRERKPPIIKLKPIKSLPVVKTPIKVKITMTPSSIIECDDAVPENNLLIKETHIVHTEHEIETSHERVPMYFKRDLELSPLPTPNTAEIELPNQKKPIRGVKVDDKIIDSSGVFRYSLSNPKFIEKGITLLPTIKVLKRMNIYKMLPVNPERNWFQKNKFKRLLFYESGEKLAEVDRDGHGRWYYKNGVVALNFYEAEEINIKNRYVIYSSGENLLPITVLACFDELGNGVVFDHQGNVRLKYNQTEGVVIDKTIGPPGRWLWHNLNEPPTLQPVYQETYDHKTKIDTSETLEEDDENAELKQIANEQMIMIELENYLKTKANKRMQKFKPFPIRVKGCRINEQFSLRVIDQKTIHLEFCAGAIRLKLNLGMSLISDVIVESDSVEFTDVFTSYDRTIPRSKSVEEIRHIIQTTKKRSLKKALFI